MTASVHDGADTRNCRASSWVRITSWHELSGRSGGGSRGPQRVLSTTSPGESVLSQACQRAALLIRGSVCRHCFPAAVSLSVQAVAQLNRRTAKKTCFFTAPYNKRRTKRESRQ